MGDVFHSGKNRRIDRTGCDDVSHASPCIRNFASEIPGDCSISSGVRVLTIHLSTLQRKLRTHFYPTRYSIFLNRLYYVRVFYRAFFFLNNKLNRALPKFSIFFFINIVTGIYRLCNKNYICQQSDAIRDLSRQNS